LPETDAAKTRDSVVSSLKAHLAALEAKEAEAQAALTAIKTERTAAQKMLQAMGEDTGRRRRGRPRSRPAEPAEPVAA